MSSFFGSVLTDRSGKFNRQDEFAGLEAAEVGTSYDFEDTYDGLGDQLQETGDDLNDDTFGDTAVGKDFDFSGQTARVADDLEEEQLTFQRRQPQYRAQQDNSVRTQASSGHHPITAPNESSWSMPSAHVGSRSSIWGHAPIQSASVSQAFQQPIPDRPTYPAQPQARKFQTLEEVEAAMLAAGRPSERDVHPQHASYSSSEHQNPQLPPPRISDSRSLPPGYQNPQYNPAVAPPFRGNTGPPGMPSIPYQNQDNAWPPISATQVSSELPRQGAQGITPSREVPTKLSLDDEASKMAQQQKNLRRAQKIGQMARYNGVMSNGDKNYVLKVQISQLVSEDPEADDFYYTVHSTLRGRSNIQQSLGHFQQTYLSRAGQSNRRGQREKQNPLLKMQQQVQKIIASAKTRPKSTSLAVEGSLGKLSFSRVRQPKQILNVKMPESSGPLSKQSKKEALQSIEKVYSTLLLLEQTGRQGPLDTANEAHHKAWDDKMTELSDEIWASLHIMDSVDNSQLHPFIQLLQYEKGKKMIPRLYRTLNPERRLTLMTMIVAHLDMLDVVRLARYDETGALPREIRESIELFSQTVLPPLLVFASNASMKIVCGLLNMLLERNHIQLICMSKIGLSFMTMFISRAEIIKQAEQIDDAEISAWQSLYNRMFSTMEGKFAYIFPPPSHQVDEIYPWQFLAACAVSASPEQQHSLVNEARDRVLDNVQATKTLPRELADTKRSNVNLFLNAIGLDASQLEA